MIRHAIAASALVAAVLTAGAAQAAPAKGFECPATLRDAQALVARVPEMGTGQSAGAYPSPVKLYNPAGLTVFGLQPKRLWTRHSDDVWGKSWVFMAEVSVDFPTASAALVKGVGKTACGTTEPRHCKFMRPEVGGHTVLQYVEWLSTGVVQIGCEYRQDATEGMPPIIPAPKPKKSSHGGHG
jgi:hypothetical protein